MDAHPESKIACKAIVIRNFFFMPVLLCLQAVCRECPETVDREWGDATNIERAHREKSGSQKSSPLRGQNSVRSDKPLIVIAAMRNKA
jgi:hypothetical protein